MLYEINVTQEDIDQGVASDPCNCAIARALLRSVPELLGVEVDTTCIQGHYATGWNTATFDADPECPTFPPCSVRSFIGEFDSRNPVQPFSFEVYV
jgi:hypothetical protein